MINSKLNVKTFLMETFCKDRYEILKDKVRDINIEVKEFDNKCKLLQNLETLVKEYFASHQINLQILEINKKSINNGHDILNSFDDF